MSVTSWFLVSSGGTRHRLPREMIFVGRDDCELMLQSRSVDKQHAVINYEVTADQHKVKDLGSLNGTFVNDVRIQEQMYFTLKLEDKLRFGYDTNLFTVVRGRLTVPEEALKHEKFTSGLDFKPTVADTSSKSVVKTPPKTSKPPRAADAKVCEGSSSSRDATRAEDRTGGDPAAGPRGTPLYGQPSWWGDGDGDADDENSFKQETKWSSKKHESEGKDARRGEKVRAQGPPGSTGQGQGSSEILMPDHGPAHDGIHEIPTKDTEGGTSQGQGGSQGHASFTIEFDSAAPGKVTIKDHVSKFTAEQQRCRSRRSGAAPGGRDLTLQAAMMASESKVADWLAQNDPTLVRSESTEDDKSIKSDVPVCLKRLKGSKHEDGTQSDSENGLGLRFANRRLALEQRLKASHRDVEGPGHSSRAPRTAFTIEFYDEENHRKRRSYSFSQTGPVLAGGAAGEGLFPQPPSHPKVFSISTSATTASESGKVPAPISATVAAGAPTAARVLLKQRSEDTSVGRSSISTGLATGSPTSPSENASATGQDLGPAGADLEDDHSDKGTYTIDLEVQNPEEEEARRMIDKVFGVQLNQDLSTNCSREGKTKKKEEEAKEAHPGDAWVSEWASQVSHTRTDPEGSGAETAAFMHKERDVLESGVCLSRGESLSSLTERKRRTLPQLPCDESRSKSSSRTLPCDETRSKSSRTLRSEVGEKQDTEAQEKENKGDGEMSSRKTSFSSPSRSLRSERRKRPEEERKEGGEGGEKSGRNLVRQGSFTIEKPSASVAADLIPRIQRGERERSDSTGSVDTAMLLKDTEAVMMFLEAKLRDEDQLEQKSSKGSFVPRTDSPESDLDTTSATSQAAGEAGLRSAAGMQKRRSLSSLHREKSNMSTASKTSVTSARERLERKTKTRAVEPPGRSDARRPVQPPSGSRARQPSLDLTDDDQTSFPISDILSSDQETYSGPGMSAGATANGRHTEDPVSARPDGRSVKTWTGTSSRTSRSLQATTSSLNKQSPLPQPRPTRASLLRRARLGDTSDNDLADADRASVASEVSTTSSTSRPPSGRKGLSRLDLLAQPRRTRVGSISARSDSECTVSRSAAAASRISAETALRLGLRSSNDNRLTARMRASSVSKLNDTKSKSSAGYCSPTVSSSSRWRRVPPEYGSTSEEEFGSNRNSLKVSRSHGRPHHLVPHRGSRPGTATSAGSALVTAPGGVGMKTRVKEQDEYIRDWTAHSEEIARLFPCVRRISQDLAKDLAILAREIHDVAGEIDSVSSSGGAPSTTVSTAATTPGSTVDAREDLARSNAPETQQPPSQVSQDRVFDDSINFRKVPVIPTNKTPEINGKPVELRPHAPNTCEPRALRRRTWNREDAVLDSLLLNSVSQLSIKIRLSADKTVNKIRSLFKDRLKNWDELENKVKVDAEVPLLRTSNKEISSILLELKRVEKQLQVMDLILDADDSLGPTGLVSRPASKEVLPEILSTPAMSSPATRAQSSSSELSVSGFTFARVRPSGEEVVAHK